MNTSILLLTSLLLTSTRLLRLAVAEDAAFTEIKSVVQCDQFGSLLKCPTNSLISVRSAFYGRTSDKFCATGPRLNYNCNIGAKALTIAAARCNNKQSCQLANEMFGDPCFGTYKYLEVTYSCRALQSAVACDDEVLKLQCPAGKYIQVRDGFFGRTSDQYCDRGPRNNYKCSHPTFKKIAAERCDNKESCSFTSSTIPLDPCPGTFKYMTVAYECLDHQLAVACGNDQLELFCPSHQVIQVIHGFFGSNTEEYCSFGPVHAYECSSPVAHKRLESWCNNKSTCILIEFLSFLGDPCGGTHKTLIVKYRCL